MIEIIVKLEQEGPHMATTVRAATTEETSTAAERDRCDEICDMLAKMIADKGGDASFVKREKPTLG